MASALRLPAVHQRAACACGCSGRAAFRAPARAAPAASRRGALAVVADSRKAVVVLTGTAGVAGAVTFTQEGNGARARPARTLAR
jgi:hypothetical protein